MILRTLTLEPGTVENIMLIYENAKFDMRSRAVYLGVNDPPITWYQVLFKLFGDLAWNIFLAQNLSKKESNSQVLFQYFSSNFSRFFH